MSQHSRIMLENVQPILGRVWNRYKVLKKGKYKGLDGFPQVALWHFCPWVVMSAVLNCCYWVWVRRSENLSWNWSLCLVQLSFFLGDQRCVWEFQGHGCDNAYWIIFLQVSIETPDTNYQFVNTDNHSTTAELLVTLEYTYITFFLHSAAQLDQVYLPCVDWLDILDK